MEAQVKFPLILNKGYLLLFFKVYYLKWGVIRVQG